MSEWKETDYGKIPSKWKFIKGTEFCSKVTDGTHDSPKQVDSGRFLVTSKHIKGRDIDFDNAYKISEEDYKKIIARSHVDQWDVIISMIGEYCGFTYIERNHLPEYAVKNVGMFKTGNEDKAKWLHYYFNSKIGKAVLEAQKTGTSQPYITLGSLRNIEILMPDDERNIKKIAEVLSSLDDKIDLLNRNNKTLEQLAETLFRQWFVEEAENEVNEISLSEISKHVKKSVNPSKTPDQFFKHYSLPAFDNGRNPETQLGRDILSNKYAISPGQILISKLNPRTPRVWFINSCNNDSICSTEFQVYEPIKKEFTEFVYCLLKSNDTRDILTGASSGTSGSHQRVNPEDINKLTIKKPNEEKIKQFHQIASVWLNKIDKNSIQIQQLETLRDTLLPKLMSGVVRVEK